MNYNSQYSGNYYQLVDGAVYVKNAYGLYAWAGAESGKMVQVQLSGYYVVDNGKTLYQTTSGGFVNLAEGWKFVMHAPIRYYSAKDTQYYVDKIIRANQQILKNNLFCATFAHKLTEEEQFSLYQLQIRLEGRNNQLIEDGFCKDLKVSTPPGYTLLSTNLDLFMSAYGGVGKLPKGTIGAVISTTTIVVAAVIIASLATAAYFAYKYLASEAEKDVEFSEELTKTLMEKLTPEEYEQLKKETQGIVTKQKLLAQFSGAGSLLKWGLLAAAGLVVYKTIKNKKKNGNS